MPSEKILIKGRCGKHLQGTLWKQGGSVKCKERGWSIVSYPKPTQIQITQDVIEICDGCPLIEGYHISEEKSHV